jgi:HlyD family secretion protein
MANLKENRLSSAPLYITPSGVPDPASPASVDVLLGAGAGSRWRFWAKIVAVALAATALVMFVGRFVAGGQATDYVSEPVVRGEIALRLFGGGKLQPVAVHPVASTAAGQLRQVLVGENEHVRRGQVLARLDPAPFRAALELENRVLEGRQAELTAAMAREREATRRLGLYERVRQQSAGRVPSDAEMLTARQDVSRTADALRAAQAEVAAANLAVAERETEMKAVDIRAPIEGDVLQRRAAVGQFVGSVPSQPLFMIAATGSRLRFDTAMDGVQARRLQQARPSRMTVTLSSGRKFTAVITRISITSAPPQPVRAATPPPRPAQGLPVGLSIEIENPGLPLTPGIAASMQVDLGHNDDILTVPDAALRFARASDATGLSGPPPGEAVYVRDTDGSPRRIPVTTHGGDGRSTAVASDLLKPGMRVITGLR